MIYIANTAFQTTHTASTTFLSPHNSVYANVML